jgi:hypothetical protein
MKKQRQSYVDKKGRAYYRHVGRYNELTKLGAAMLKDAKPLEGEMLNLLNECFSKSISDVPTKL